MCLCITSRAEDRSLRSSRDRRPPHGPSRLDSTKGPSIRLGLDLRWPATYTGSTQELAYKPVDPSSPLQKLTRTLTIVSFILKSTDVWFCPPQCGLCSLFAQNKAERLSVVDPGISRGVADLYPPRGYTHPVTRAIEVSQAAWNAEF